MPTLYRRKYSPVEYKSNQVKVRNTTTVCGLRTDMNELLLIRTGCRFVSARTAKALSMSNEITRCRYSRHDLSLEKDFGPYHFGPSPYRYFVSQLSRVTAFVMSISNSIKPSRGCPRSSILPLIILLLSPSIFLSL